MTQKEKILSLCWNKFAGPSEFMEAGIAQYNARIHELKDDGWVFEDKVVSALDTTWTEHRMNANENKIMTAEYYSAKQTRIKV